MTIMLTAAVSSSVELVTAHIHTHSGGRLQKSGLGSLFATVYNESTSKVVAANTIVPEIETVLGEIANKKSQFDAALLVTAIINHLGLTALDTLFATLADYTAMTAQGYADRVNTANTAYFFF